MSCTKEFEGGIILPDQRKELSTMGFAKYAEDDYEILLDRVNMSSSIDTLVPIVAGKEACE